MASERIERAAKEVEIVVLTAASSSSLEQLAREFSFALSLPLAQSLLLSSLS